MVANRFGGICKLPNEFLQTSKSTDCCALECAGELLHINKLGSLAPRKDGFHPKKELRGEERRGVETGKEIGEINTLV